MLVNLEKIILLSAIAAVTILIATVVNFFFVRLIKRSMEDMRSNPTNYQFLRRALVVMIYLFGMSIAIYTIPSLRTLASSLLAGAGILAVSVGFASQHALSNIISGFFIVLFKPFKITDRLKIREMNGIVEDITLRHVVIRDFENKRIVIPNSIISNEIIINSDFTEDKICKWMDIGISYSSDIDLAKRIIAEEVLAHPLHVDPRTPEQLENGMPEVMVRVLLLGDSSVMLRGWAWAKNAKESFEMSCDLYESIKKRFDKEGIEIPFPHRTVYLKNDISKV
jgi:small-conductance mechanosensitive channel